MLSQIEAYASKLSSEHQAYWSLHKLRFAQALRLVKTLKRELPIDSPILDIGNSFQTLLFADGFPKTPVDTLGYFDRTYHLQKPSRHFEYDLNQAIEKATWPTPPSSKYGIITFLEVIEHLYTSPLQVLPFLKTFLEPSGFLVIQTPNAAALKKRLKLLRGVNPYEKIRLDRSCPGHFREYTPDELSKMSAECGLLTRKVEYNNFTIDGSKWDRLWDRLANYLPRSFKSGFTMILQKPSEEI